MKGRRFESGWGASGALLLMAMLSGSSLAAQTEPVGPPPGGFSGPEGFGLRSSDGAFLLRFRGGIQYDGRFFLPHPDHGRVDQLQARRVRMDLQGTLYRNYDFRAYADLAGSRVDLLDAYVNARFSPALQIRAGKMKSPIGLERLQTPFTMTFAERALPTSVVPNRDNGMLVHGIAWGDRFEYAAGLFNGVPDGSSADGDDGNGKDLIGRVFIAPLRDLGGGPLQGLGVGVAGTRGRQEGRTAAPALAQYRTAGRELFFAYRAAATGTALATGIRTRITPQVTWYWKNLGALGEYVLAEQTVTLGGSSRTLVNRAWQAAGSWVVTGEPTSYRGVVPSRTFNSGERGWGALEIAVRTDGLRVDPATFPTFADPTASAREAIAHAVGLNWYLNRAVRVLVNYERTRFTSADGTRFPTENVFISRFQITF